MSERACPQARVREGRCLHIRAHWVVGVIVREGRCLQFVSARAGARKGTCLEGHVSENIGIAKDENPNSFFFQSVSFFQMKTQSVRFFR